MQEEKENKIYETGFDKIHPQKYKVWYRNWFLWFILSLVMLFFMPNYIKLIESEQLKTVDQFSVGLYLVFIGFAGLISGIVIPFLRGSYFLRKLKLVEPLNIIFIIIGIMIMSNMVKEGGTQVIIDFLSPITNIL